MRPVEARNVSMAAGAIMALAAKRLAHRGKRGRLRSATVAPHERPDQGIRPYAGALRR